MNTLEAARAEWESLSKKVKAGIIKDYGDPTIKTSEILTKYHLKMTTQWLFNVLPHLPSDHFCPYCGDLMLTVQAPKVPSGQKKLYCPKCGHEIFEIVNGPNKALSKYCDCVNCQRTIRLFNNLMNERARYGQSLKPRLKVKDLSLMDKIFLSALLQKENMVIYQHGNYRLDQPHNYSVYLFRERNTKPIFSTQDQFRKMLHSFVTRGILKLDENSGQVLHLGFNGLNHPPIFDSRNQHYEDMSYILNISDLQIQEQIAAFKSLKWFVYHSFKENELRDLWVDLMTDGLCDFINHRWWELINPQNYWETYQTVNLGNRELISQLLLAGYTPLCLRKRIFEIWGQKKCVKTSYEQLGDVYQGQLYETLAELIKDEKNHPDHKGNELYEEVPQSLTSKILFNQILLLDDIYSSQESWDNPVDKDRCRNLETNKRLRIVQMTRHRI